MLTPVDEAEAPEEKALGAAAEGNTSVRSIEVPSCMDAAAGGGRGESVGESAEKDEAPALAEAGAAAVAGAICG